MKTLMCKESSVSVKAKLNTLENLKGKLSKILLLNKVNWL